MPLTLDQYATYLDQQDLAWPAAPVIERPKAKPGLLHLEGIKVVLYNVYGTLLAISEGELLFEHPNKMIMDIVLEKTLEQYKMWGSMVRKPGQPAEYLGEMYRRALEDQRLLPSRDKHPEIVVEKIWENIVKKLMAKEYKFDTGLLGSLNEYTRKIAYFFHASMQSTTCYPGVAQTLETLQQAGIRQGLLADAQCFTVVQLARGLREQLKSANLDEWLDPQLRVLSYEQRVRKPSPKLFETALDTLAQKDISPQEVLYVGSDLQRDIAPARKAGMRAALFAGDKASLRATPDGLRDPATRPDVMLTELSQLTFVVLGEDH